MSIFEGGDARQPPAASPATDVRKPAAGTSPAPQQNAGAEADPLGEALRITQEGLRSMQVLQQQTAAAHERFLKTQEEAHKALQAVMKNQQRLMERVLGVAPAPSAESLATEASAPASTAAAPATAPTTAAPGEIGDDEGSRAVEAALLQVVSEKTGYPPDALHLDMHLEDDLGIDAVRRVEILAALAERIPAANVAASGPVPGGQTLRDIVRGVLSPTTSLPDLAPAAEVVVGDRGEAQPPESATTAPEFERIVLESVAELTGYPAEMLELDMDLEADLGIDSIKRLEILGAVQRRVPEMEAVNAQHLGGLRTLRNISDYVRGGVGLAAVSSAAAESTPQPARPAPSREAAVAPNLPAAKLERRVLATVELPPAQQRPLRIASGREVWVSDDGTPLAPTLVRRLVSLGHAARVIRPRAGWKNAAERKVGGLILLGSPAAPDGPSWGEEAEDELKLAFRRVKALAPSLRDAAGSGGALLATVSRLDGAFGGPVARQAGSPPSFRGTSFNPLLGGLSGLAKTAAHEWPEVCCRALDVSRGWQDAEAVADAIISELSSDGPLEVGLDDRRRVGLETIPTSVTPGSLPLADGDVVVISGGARGVTAEAALALAQAARPALILLGRSPEPTPEPEWLASLEDEAEIKRALLAHAFGASKRVSPIELEAEYRRCMANREVLRNLERLQASGATVIYRSVDVRDPGAVAALFDEVRREHGPVRGLVHAAGVIEDHRIEDKTPEQFARVFDTKVVGLRALLEALRGDDLRFMVFFSSVSGRFGRAGQVDYAMANEVLNKVAHQQAALRPNCRVVSINWGPWDGGMVTPALKNEFARLGIKLIPLEAGARCMIDEVCVRGRDEVEVLIGGSFPKPASPAPRGRRRPAQTVPTDGRMSVAFERELDVESHPFLGSHVINGHPVLPVAMILEWLGHGALHDSPGLVLHGFDDFRVLKGVILDDGPKAIRVCAARARRDGDVFETVAELRSGRPGEREYTHARAKALLATRLPPPPPFELPADLAAQPYAPGVEAVYRDILFHGPHFRGIKSVEGISERGMVARVRTAPAPTEWMAAPLRTAWLGDPLAVDAGLQLGVLWCHARMGAVSLPSYGTTWRQYHSFPSQDVTIALEVRETGPTRMAADLTFLDTAGKVIARMERHEWTVDPSLRAAFERNVVVGV